jgi:ribosome-associated protein
MDDIRVTKTVSVPVEELEFRFSTSGGPGGEQRAMRNTRVELLFDVAGSSSLGPEERARALDRLASRLDAHGHLRLVVTEERSQARNREIAVERFRELLADALRPYPPPRIPTERTLSSEEDRLFSKHARARLKLGRAADAGE